MEIPLTISEPFGNKNLIYFGLFVHFWLGIFFKKNSVKFPQVGKTTGGFWKSRASFAMEQGTEVFSSEDSRFLIVFRWNLHEIKS